MTGALGIDGVRRWGKHNRFFPQGSLHLHRDSIGRAASQILCNVLTRSIVALALLPRSAANALRAFGPQADSAVPKLLAALKPALVGGRSEASRSLAAALQSLSHDPQQVLWDHFHDPELRRLAFELLR